MTFHLVDVEQVLQKKSWWAMIFVLPIARRISLLIANKTQITPNQITLFSFLFILPACYFFSLGTQFGFLMGAIFFEINYLFDCVDGTIARLKNLSSHFGGYLDGMLDRIRIVLLCICFGLGSYKFSGSILCLVLLIAYLGINNLIIISRAYQSRIFVKIGQAGRKGTELVSQNRKGILGRWIDFTEKRNVMPYYHDVELDSLVFVVGPLLLMFPLTLIVAVLLGFILLIAINILFVISIKKELI